MHVSLLCCSHNVPLQPTQALTYKFLQALRSMTTVDDWAPMVDTTGLPEDVLAQGRDQGEEAQVSEGQEGAQAPAVDDV